MKKIIFTVISILVLAGGFYKFIYIPKITYETNLISKDDFQQDIFATGIIDSEIIYQISSNITGKVINLLVKEGQVVKKGQVLAIIDGIDLKEKIAEDEYSIDKAVSNQAITLNKIEEAKAKYNLAELQLKRYTKLHKDGVVADLDYENIKLAEVVAKASLKALENDKIAYDSELKRLDATLKGTKEKFNNLVLKAPNDGILVQKDIEFGDTAIAGKILFKIVNPKDVWVKAYVDEAVSGDIKINQSVEIKLRSKENETIKGFVKKIDFISDAITNEREIGVGFQNIPKQFFLNEQAEVRIVTKTFQNVLLCESKNIIKYENQNGIWIYKNGFAFFTPIKILGRSANIDFVMIEGDIKENDTVIIPDENKKTLHNGATVRL